MYYDVLAGKRTRDFVSHDRRESTRNVLDRRCTQRMNIETYVHRDATGLSDS